MRKYLVLLFMFLFCLAGCSLDRDVHLVRAGSHTFNHGSTYIIDSVSDLNDYVVNTYNDFDKSIIEYDEEYFKSSALVIVEITKNSGSYKLKVNTAKIDDDKLTIKFKSKAPGEYVTMDMAYWHIIVECSQEELASFSSVEVYENGNKVEERN